MKKNKMMRLASGLLVAVLLTTCAIAGTFAKYTTEFEGTDSARVAKFTVNSNAASFDIFDVSKIYDTKDDASFSVKSDDADVDNGATDGLIAPGTWGEFTFTVSDASEVTVNYAIDYTVEATVLAGDASIKVMWKWTYEGDDGADTTLGVAGSAAPKVDVVVTFTQVD